MGDIVPIHRAEHKENFTQILNNLLNDSKLSYGARGLMAHVLTHYDDWIFTGEDYFITEVDKKVKIRGYIKELINTGYLKRYRETDKKGRLGNSIYIFYEKPNCDLPNLEKPILENIKQDKTKKMTGFLPNCDLPNLGLPNLEKPILENRTLNNTNITNSIYKKEKKKSELDIIIDSYTSNEELRKALRDFLKMRKAIKKPMTDRAMTLILNKLDKLGNSDNEKIEVLNQSIVNSWQGIFELKHKSSKANFKEVPKINIDDIEL